MLHPVVSHLVLKLIKNCTYASITRYVRLTNFLMRFHGYFFPLYTISNQKRFVIKRVKMALMLVARGRSSTAVFGIFSICMIKVSVSCLKIIDMSLFVDNWIPMFIPYVLQYCRKESLLFMQLHQNSKQVGSHWVSMYCKS